MGKGEIVSGGDNGQYQVKLLLDRRRITDELFGVTKKIATVTDELALLTPGTSEYELKDLELNSLILRKQFLLSEVPEDPTISAWCADLTEDLTGIVGTIEVPGERGTVLVHPGFDNNAEYDEERDGVLQPSEGGTPESVFFNWSLRPGWQRWMPTYRFGVIIAISGNNCDIRLYNAQSSDQGLPLNQTGALSNVPIEYMDCDGDPFVVGDEVLIKFEGQNWENPKVIGFKDNPKPCNRFFIRLMIDGNELIYGGQRISITYTKTDDSSVETDWKYIRGRGDNAPDNQKYGIAGPFFMENWNKGAFFINLLRDRSSVAKLIPLFKIITIHQSDCDEDNPYGETERYRGAAYMHNYFVEDAVDGDIRVWKWADDISGAFGRSGGESCANGLWQDTFPNVQWTVQRRRVGVTKHTGSPATDYTYSSEKYRLLNKISKQYQFADMAFTSETVFNYDTFEYETALVWELDIPFNLKIVHVHWWMDDPNWANSPWNTCPTSGCSGVPQGWFPTPNSGGRHLYRFYWNDFPMPDDVDPDIGAFDFITSMPFIEYANQGSCSLALATGCYAWAGITAFWAVNRPECIIDSYSFSKAGSVNDWSEVSLNISTPPILIVTDETDLTPTLPGIINENSVSDLSNMSFPMIMYREDDCSFLQDPGRICVTPGVDELTLPQKIEMVDALEYWY